MRMPILPLCLLAALLCAASAAARPKREREAPGRLAALIASRPTVEGELSLDRAVAVAMKESPIIRGAAEELRVSIAQLRRAKSARYPWLSLQTLYTGGSQARMFPFAEGARPSAMRGVPGDTFFEQALSFIYPLYTGGRLDALVDRARFVRKADTAGLQAVRQEVALLVRIAYREVQARASYVGVYQALVDENEERKRIDTIAFEQQRVPAFYLLRDEAELADARQASTNAQRDLAIALVQLKTLMGINLNSPVQIPAAGTGDSGGIVLAGFSSAEEPDLPSLESLLEIAERRRPELAAAGHRVRAGDKGVRAARARFLPQVNIGAVGNVFRMRGTDLRGGGTFGLIATFPLSDAGARNAAVDGARAGRRRRQAMQEQVALRVAREVSTALLRLKAARENLTTAGTGLESAREDYRVVQLRVAAGRGINLEALDALAVQVRGENNLVQARLDYDVAEDQLLYATGQLQTESVDEAPPSGASDR